MDSLCSRQSCLLGFPGLDHFGSGISVFRVLQRMKAKKRRLVLSALFTSKCMMSAASCSSLNF